MRIPRNAIPLLLLVSLGAHAAEDDRFYKWVDEDGVVHYGDSVPPDVAELPKEVLNDQGVAVQQLEGKKTEEQLAAERKAQQLRQQKELQRRKDQALLATYLNVDEIIMHRDRRIELFQAQSRVTELYLRNLERRLTGLRERAARFRPYSDDSEAPMIEADLVADIQETQETISRHEKNLLKFREDEQQIIARFEGDITRFKTLRGVN